MHEQAPILKAKKREKLGSRYSRRVREQGGLPAVVYGHKQEPLAVTLEARDALKHIHKGEKVFRLEFEGGSVGTDHSGETVLLRDLQFDYLGTNIVHCDLARVDLTERVRVMVAVHLIGEARGLKTSGATLMHPTSQLEIECTVMNIPEYIEVTVTDLGVGGSIRARDVQLPADTRLVSDPDAEVAHVLEPTVQTETAESATVGGTAAPEVIGEKKKEEGGAAAKK